MSDALRAFIEKAKESLVASKLLADNQLYDFAGSRAYYTMFYIAEAFLWQQRLSFSSHSAVIAKFGQEVARKGIVPLEFHQYLIDAQDKRTQADYNIEQDVRLSQEDVRQLIQQCKAFIKQAESVLLRE